MSARRVAQAYETQGVRVVMRAHESGAASSGGRMANQERGRLPRKKVAATAEMSAKRGWRQTGLVAVLALLSMLGTPVTARAASDATTPKAAATPAVTRVAPALGSGLTPGAPIEMPAIVGDSNIAGPALLEAEEVQGGGSPSETVEFYAYDAIGSVRMVFDAAGTVVGQATYSPFGQEIAGTTGMPAQRFTGQERDHEAQLDYFNARAFQARTGRFNAPDPLYTGAIENPQRWNRYAYALNNPLSFTDPSGLEVCSETNRTFVDDQKKVHHMVDLTCSPGGSWFDYFSTSIVDALTFSTTLSKDGDLQPLPTYQPTVWEERSVTAALVVLTVATGRAGGLKGRVASPLANAAVKTVATEVTEATAVTGGAAAVRVGQAGEAAVRAAFNIGPPTRIYLNGRWRIPDGLTPATLSEIKNVRSLSNTEQLRDFMTFSQQTGREFHLYIRSDTRLSGPLLRAVQSGQINLRYIPGL